MNVVYNPRNTLFYRGMHRDRESDFNLSPNTERIADLVRSRPAFVGFKSIRWENRLLSKISNIEFGGSARCCRMRPVILFARCAHTAADPRLLYFVDNSSVRFDKFPAALSKLIFAQSEFLVKSYLIICLELLYTFTFKRSRSFE